MSTDHLVRGRLAEHLQQAVAGDFAIDGIDFDQTFGAAAHAIRLRGRFLTPTERAYDAISERARPARLLIFFRREAGHEMIYAVPDQLPPAIRPRVDVAVGLFLATLLSVFFTGATIMRPADAGVAFDWRSGLTYALPLMTILLAHELGHFFVARHNRMGVSPPYFIPLPFISFGTLGAVIALLAPPKNRRQLLRMAAAGPLAGLFFTIPILIYGLSTSPVGPLPTEPYMLEGNSLLYAGLKLLVFGRMLPSADGLDVSLNNIAFAGWMGLLVTALNLIPAGQLDGGHAIFTLFGERVRPVTWVLIAVMVGLALWSGFWGWLLWAFLLYFFGRFYAVPMDDLTPLDARHKALAIIMLLLFVLIFSPIPMQQITP